ncbi:polysaccharide deacetylase family protein [Methylobacterium sp. 092160098-2]|uniref:polysaccharide deacetylase family protein n=1 Tax=Methylobacterium sp. 092160098-2 TaxID=3025129 RepID=UPI002381A0FA|nr:polysaccharide deacetylase family protein [Methylobacterium sp. 092160098-2]MDE4912797.1 polysaccharide deacetylase family protein [Methylobacterium sp. 092160098-2]
MILCYHKIYPVAKTHWWLTVDKFYQQMAALQSYNVVLLDEYDPNDPSHVVITFDGVYDNVLEHALPILRQFSYPFELFVIGDWIGRDNTFDQTVEPSCHFASVEQLDALVAGGGRVQWHTRSHRRFTGLDQVEAAGELQVPEWLRTRYGPEHLTWFAYPHGAVDDSVREVVKSYFKGALACDDGDQDDLYYLPRTLVFENHNFFRSKSAVTVVLRDKPWLLRDTLDTLERQIVPFDRIFVTADVAQREFVQPIIDALDTARQDGMSFRYTDHTGEDICEYQTEVAAGDRLRSDYGLLCRVALDCNPNAAAVTTGVFDFGSNGAGSSANEISESVRSTNTDSALEAVMSGRLEADRGVSVMRRLGAAKDAETLHLGDALYERCIDVIGVTGDSATVSTMVRELCTREAELIQRAAIIRVRDQEIERLNASYADAFAEIDRCNREHTLNAAEIIRLNLAYGSLETELRRVNEAYGSVSAELVRVNEAYGSLSAGLDNIKRKHLV